MVTPIVRRAIGRCLAAAALVFIGHRAALLAQDVAGSDAMTTQEAILKAMTVENLIGNAVSLSNQTYPDVEKAIQRFKNGDTQGAREFLDIAKQKYPKLPPVDLIIAKLHVISRNGPAARVSGADRHRASGRPRGVPDPGRHRLYGRSHYRG